MKKFVFLNSLGEPVYTAVPSSEDTYVDGNRYGDLVCREIPFESDDQEVLRSWFWRRSGGWGVRPECPSAHHRWNPEVGAWQDSRSMDELRSARWGEIKAQRDAAEWGGFDTPFGRFDSDPKSQAKIIGAVQLASIAAARGEPFSIRWTLQDNSTVVLDAPAMIAVGVAMGQHIDSVHQIGRAKRAAIEAATTRDAVMAVTWSEGS
jgi:hypothetical protein